MIRLVYNLLDLKVLNTDHRYQKKTKLDKLSRLSAFQNFLLKRPITCPSNKKFLQKFNTKQSKVNLVGVGVTGYGSNHLPDLHRHPCSDSQKHSHKNPKSPDNTVRRLMVCTPSCFISRKAYETSGKLKPRKVKSLPQRYSRIEYKARSK